jgi:hypothetical protein
MTIKMQDLLPTEWNTAQFPLDTISNYDEKYEQNSSGGCVEADAPMMMVVAATNNQRIPIGGVDGKHLKTRNKGLCHYLLLLVDEMANMYSPEWFRHCEEVLRTRVLEFANHPKVMTAMGGQKAVANISYYFQSPRCRPNHARERDLGIFLSFLLARPVRIEASLYRWSGLVGCGSGSDGAVLHFRHVSPSQWLGFTTLCDSAKK